MDARHVVHLAQIGRICWLRPSGQCVDHHAELVLFHRLDDLLEILIVRILEEREDLVVLLGAAFDRCGALEFGEGRFAFALFDDAHRLGDVLGERLADPLVEVGVDREQWELALLLADLLASLSMARRSS